MAKPDSPLKLVLGLMSGTSADSIDVSLAQISGAPPRLRSKLLDHTSIDFPRAVRNQILRVAEQQPVSAGELSQLNFRLGGLFAEAALSACSKFGISPGSVALIGSHGQTLFHQGRPTSCFGAPTASTLQVGDASVIAARTGITTVADFRPADMAEGGQGAPLVPYTDYLLYRHPRLGRLSLNLGGIANVTVIPRAAKPSEIVAFDTGPANMVIDALVRHFTWGRQSFDRDARLAARGRSIPALLSELLRDPYLKLPPPKSTGREYFGRGYLDRLLSAGRRHRAKPNDLVRAATIFASLSIVDALNRFVLPKTRIDQLIVSGGGSRNPLILAQLQAALGAGRNGPAESRVGKSNPEPGRDSRPGAIEIVRSSQFGIPEQAKEAYAFALLAYETAHRRTGNLPTATGAGRPAILGKISYARPR